MVGTICTLIKNLLGPGVKFRNQAQIGGAFEAPRAGWSIHWEVETEIGINDGIRTICSFSEGR